MSKKNIIAIIFFIILSSASLWIYLHITKSTIRKELYDFAVTDTASINKIYLVNKDGSEVLLEKVNPGEWKVNKKHIARRDAIKALLVCIKELAVKNPVAKNAIENISKQLATTGTKIEIYQNDNLIKLYYVGGDAQDGLSTYMLLADHETGENSTMPFEMFIPGFNGFLSVRYFTDADLWRDRTVFAHSPDKISSITFNPVQMPDSGFTVSLSTTNEISLHDSKGNLIAYFDTLKMKRYITYFSNIQYVALENKCRQSYKDSILSKKPVFIITLSEKNGKINSLKVFSKPPDDITLINDVTGKPFTEDPEYMFALVNDDKDFVLIQYYSFGKLFVGNSYFKKKIENRK
ncbi:MAG: hypothetical protein V1781_05055 [Bacteroidota bacterium]